MTNPYNYMRADHRAPYHLYEIQTFIDDALEEVGKAIKEVGRSNGAYESDAIDYLKLVKTNLTASMTFVNGFEKEMLVLWEDHHKKGNA